MLTSVHPKRNLTGFTLIELLVTVAILAIVLAIAAPSLIELQVGNQIKTSAGDWALAVQKARAHAVKERGLVTICVSSDGATCLADTDYTLGWIMKTGDSGNNGRILSDFPPPNKIVMTANRAASAITFLGNGQPSAAFIGLRIEIAQAGNNPNTSLSRYLCVAPSGRVRTFNEAQYSALTAGECQ